MEWLLTSLEDRIVQSSALQDQVQVDSLLDQALRTLVTAVGSAGRADFVGRTGAAAGMAGLGCACGMVAGAHGDVVAWGGDCADCGAGAFGAVDWAGQTYSV